MYVGLDVHKETIAVGVARSGKFNRTATWSDEKPGDRWRAHDYEELVNRDKASPDIFWLKDESLEDLENLPPPDVLAQEIVDDLEAALEQFREIAEDLNGAAVENEAG
jgi:type I restriction enzyme M protein